MKKIARFVAQLAVACAPAAFACGGNAPPPVTTLAVASSAAPSASESAEPEYAYPPDGEIPKLRTGKSTPYVVADTVSARVVSRHVGDLETLLVAIALTPEQGEHANLIGEQPIAIDVQRAPGEPSPYAFVDRTAQNADETPSELRVWVRRPAKLAGLPCPHHAAQC